ncbi:MAG: hypothetical protein AAF787_15285 [Chloroflexota bacterium]
MRRWLLTVVIVCSGLAGGAFAQEATPTTPALDAGNAPLGQDRPSQILLAARNDIELLANNTLGASVRPATWNGTFDVMNPQMALHARLDLETLADQVLQQTRPPGWFGVQPTTAFATARDIRHDVELLADTVVAPSVRPPNWLGDEPIMRCNRSTQALVELLESRNLLMTTASPASPTYCADLEAEVSVFTELNLLEQPEPAPAAAAATQAAPQNPNAQASIVTPGTIVYFDRGALEIAGIIPQGELFTPVARSYAQFSRMMLIRGEGFELFVDYQNTTLDAPTFEALGDINVIDVAVSCALDWCQSPAP